MEFKSYEYGHGYISSPKKPRRNMVDLQPTQGKSFNSTGGLSSDGTRMRSNWTNSGKLTSDFESSMLSRQSTAKARFTASNLYASSGNIKSMSHSLTESPGNMQFVSSGLDQSPGNMNFLSSVMDQSTGIMNYASSDLDQSIGNLKYMSSGLDQSIGSINFASGLDQSIANINFVSGLDKSNGNMKFASGLDQSIANMNFSSSGLDQSIKNMNFVSSGLDQSIRNMNFVSSGLDQSIGNMNFVSSGLDQSIGNMNFVSSGLDQSIGNMNIVSSGLDYLTVRQPRQRNLQQRARDLKVLKNRAAQSLGGNQRLCSNSMERTEEGYSSLDPHGMARRYNRRPEEILKESSTADEDIYERLPSKRHIEIEPYDMERNIERGFAMERGSRVSKRRIDDRRHVYERELYDVKMFGERYITDRYLGNDVGIVQTVEAKSMKRSVNQRPHTMNRVPNIDGERQSIDREPRGKKRGYEGLNHTIDRDLYERHSDMEYMNDESDSRAWENEREERSRKRKGMTLRAGDLRDAGYRHDISVREHRSRMDNNLRVSMEQDHDMMMREEINDLWMSKRFSDKRPSYDEDKNNMGLCNDNHLSQYTSGLQRHSLTKETSRNKQKHKQNTKKLKTAEGKPITVKEKIEHLIATMKKDFTPKRLSETGFAGFFNFGLIKSQISFMKHFNFKQFCRVGNGKMATNWLFIGDIFLARVFGTVKGDNKKECYEKAINVLLSKPVEEILKQEDPGVDSEADELLSNYENMPPEDDETEDLAEKKEKYKAHRQSIKLLVDYLNPHNTSRQEVVEYLEMAFKESRCDLGYNYYDIELTWFNGMPWFIGFFELEDIPIAAASGSCRHSAKKNAFEKAMKFLHGNSLYVVTEGISVDRRELMPAIEKVTDQIDLPTLKSRNKLNTFLGKLKENRKKETEPRTRIKECAKNLCLSVLVVDRRNPPASKNFETVLYLDNIFITSSENSHHGKRTALFDKALKVLLSTSADDIYNNFKRLCPEDVHGVFQAEEMTRDLQLVSHFSNNYTAVKWEPQTFKMSTSEENLKDLTTDRDNIIVFEKAEWAADRYDNSLMILRFIAMKNRMPFHIIVIHDECVNKFRVRLFILHEFVSEAVHSSREAAKKRAAASYLFKLYQTQPTIMIRPEDGSTRLVTFEAMKALAANLKEESGATGPEEEDEVMMTYKEMKHANRRDDPDESPDDDPNNQAAFVKINTWIGKAAECLMEGHFSRETLETLKFGERFPPGYSAYIRMLAHKHGHATTKIRTWLSVNHRYPLSKTLEILKRNNGQSGKYTIIPKTDLPRPCDLDLLAQENNV